jgi:hypothetical protein
VRAPLESWPADVTGRTLGDDFLCLARQRAGYSAGRRIVPVEIWPDIGAALAARAAGEAIFDVGQAHTVRPLVGADRDVMAALQAVFWPHGTDGLFFGPKVTLGREFSG